MKGLSCPLNDVIVAGGEGGGGGGGGGGEGEIDISRPSGQRY